MATDGQATKGNAAILISVLVVFALVLGGFGWSKYRLGEASTSWPTVDGQIVSAKLDSTRSDGKTKYQPSVSYNYTVDGTSYVGARISAISSYGSRGKADVVLARYRTGTKVSVHYDPANPRSSVLEPGAGRDAVFILVAAAACLALAMLILVSALRRAFGG